ncbi:hypothetical protein K504DRAFT_445611 [Pleomassaria siparia CBS 279.74]|uniref:Uncharacterized protein n=1 Tax=Pleomassaria siparia CBS 279.74 TaxID=1314801 RepID=A0A6G1KP67_9PLEO|nr:hypothetical protein K504DRAFT_445611 [Pleomassaria siparia CBS 279.74]
MYDRQISPDSEFFRARCTEARKYFPYECTNPFVCEGLLRVGVEKRVEMAGAGTINPGSRYCRLIATPALLNLDLARLLGINDNGSGGGHFLVPSAGLANLILVHTYISVMLGLFVVYTWRHPLIEGWQKRDIDENVPGTLRCEDPQTLRKSFVPPNRTLMANQVLGDRLTHNNNKA